MIVSFNPTISNKKHTPNFGKIDEKIISKYKTTSPGSVINNELASLQYNRKQDLIDTIRHILGFESAPGRQAALNRLLNVAI